MKSNMLTMLATLLLLGLSLCGVNCDHHRSKDGAKFGVMLGEFPKNSSHGIKGTIFVPKMHTFYVKNFSYDGIDELAEFQLGFDGPAPLTLRWGRNYAEGLIKLKKFENENILLNTDATFRIESFRDLSVWSTSKLRPLASVFPPAGFSFPEPYSLGPMKGAHNVSSSGVTILDAKTIKFDNLYYDGKGPDAYFLVGKNGLPNENGIKVPIMTIKCPPGAPKDPCIKIGKVSVLPEFRGDDVTIRLPSKLSVFDIKWISIFCIQFKHNFAHLMIPPGERLGNLPADMIPLMHPDWIEPEHASPADNQRGANHGVNVSPVPSLISMVLILSISKIFT